MKRSLGVECLVCGLIFAVFLFMVILIHKASGQVTPINGGFLEDDFYISGDGTLALTAGDSPKLLLDGATGTVFRIWVDDGTDDLQIDVNTSATEAIDITNLGTGVMDLIVDGRLTGGNLTLTGFDCTGNANGGALTADASGIVSCTDDDSGAGATDSIEIEDGDNAGTFTAIDTTARFDDSGDLNFAVADGGAGGPDIVTATVRANSVALTTDTTGNYADGDAEAGAALTGDSATAFFSTGEIEDARVVDALTVAGGTIGTSAITLVQGAAPTPTAEGVIEWETDDDHIIIGDGVDQVEFVPTEDVSGDVTMDTAGAVTIATDAIGTGELDDDANSPTAGDIVIVETGAASFDYIAQSTFAAATHAAQHTTGGGDAVAVTSAMITNDQIVNADINSAAAIAISKTALVAGTNITLSTNTLNVDDAFLVNSAADEAGGDIGFADGDGPEMGTDDDAKFYYDETDDIFILGSIDGASSNIENALITFAADADNNETETADQEIFEIGLNGLGDPAGTWVEKLALDEDGDLSITGSYTGTNVTSGADPGHTHTATSVSGVPDSGFVLVDAGAMIPRATNGPDFSTEEYATNDIMFDQWLFDGATEEGTQWDLDLPEEYDGGTITATYYWIAPTGSTASDGVVWGTECQAWGDSDAADSAWGTQINVTDAVITVGDIHVSPTSAAITIGGTPTDAKIMKCQTTRVVADAGDDMTEDAKLVRVKVVW